MQEEQKREGFSISGIIIIVVVFLAAVVGGGLYYGEVRKQNILDQNIVEIEKQVEGLKSRKPLFPKQSIRTRDLEAYLVAKNPEFDTCRSSQPPISIEGTNYADLDHDGEEEAVVVGRSCFSGTGGYDILEVLKIDKDGKLVTLETADENHVIPPLSKGGYVAGHLFLGIEEGRLIQISPVYYENDANCCPSGGTRKLIYGWDGKKFQVERVVDTPDKKEPL